jgi:hypothetical protein
LSLCNQARAAYGDRAGWENVAQHPEKLAEMLPLTGGRRQVRVIVEEEKVTIGFAGETFLRGDTPLFSGT